MFVSLFSFFFFKQQGCGNRRGLTGVPLRQSNMHAEEDNVCAFLEANYRNMTAIEGLQCEQWRRGLDGVFQKQSVRCVPMRPTLYTFISLISKRSTRTRPNLRVSYSALVWDRVHVFTCAVGAQEQLTCKHTYSL